MINLRTCTIVFGLTAIGLMAVPATLGAQALSHYREYALGSTVASVAKASGARPGDIRVIHQRPATIQELRWRPQSRYTDSSGQIDPVREVVFTFYNDQLFQVTVDYDRQRTEGLTDADLIETMAATYGVPVLQATMVGTSARTPAALSEGDVTVARWSDATSSLTLMRGSYPTSVRLVLALTSVDALARTAAAEAAATDVQEAPQREVDRQARLLEDGRVARERARTANRVIFKP